MEAKASFKKIVDFLTNLGTQHVDINSVYRWNRLELTGTFRTGAPLSAMLIDSIETFVTNPNSRSYNQNNCAFTILGKAGVSTAKIDSYAQQNEVLEHTQEIAFEVAARIKDAALNTNLLGPLKWLYGNVEQDSFHFYKVGPVFTEQLYGYRCEFTIKTKQSYQPDPTKWNDLISP